MAVTGFIGLGVMGREMASHLVAAGHTVQAFDVNAKAVEALRLKAAKATTGGIDAAAGPDAVILILPDGKMRIPPIALEDIVHRRDLPGLVLRVRRDDGDLPAGPGEVVVRNGRQAEQPLHFANIDCSIWLDLKLFFFAGHQSAVPNRCMVNSIAPPGNSRQRSTSLI